MNRTLRALLSIACLASGSLAFAQAPAPPIVPGPTPVIPPAAMPRRAAPPVSPQIADDGRVTFRIFAPQATAVTLGGDINQGLNREAPAPNSAAPAPTLGIPMTKGPDGIWTGTSALPMKPGAWRYHFMVDSMTVVDSRNVNTSPYQAQMESLLIFPGDFSETATCPMVQYQKFATSRPPSTTPSGRCTCTRHPATKRALCPTRCST